MLNHQIFPTQTGYFLEILESAVVGGSRVRPFIFKTGYNVNSVMEALAILDLIQETKTSLPTTGIGY